MTLPGGAKAWQGRLRGRTAPGLEDYTHSLDADRAYWREDLAGSRAHARMLRAVGVLAGHELRAIEQGLDRIRAELEGDRFPFAPGDEDIHMAVERRLIELVGTPGAKLHTGRSRNDQVALDLRLFARRAQVDLAGRLVEVQAVLLRRAREHRRTLLAGYTHLQRAQPTTLAHHLLAYIEMLQRDLGRLLDAHRRTDVSPLGSGALCGTTLPIDREAVARDLGFAQITANSLDAVGDRDFAVETVFACALCAGHGSRLAEEMVLWSSAEFGFVQLPDAWATGSSLMPQKKNPDVFELLRARAGRVLGDLVACLAILKGLPLSYNRDLQEATPPLLDAVATTLAGLTMLAEVLAAVHFDQERMAEAAGDPQLLATDVAEHLVRQGVPFREAHAIVGRAVRTALRRRISLADLDLADWQRLHPGASADLLLLFDAEDGLRRRELPGGPGPRTVGRALQRADLLIRRNRRQVELLEARLP
ncbi:MAG TPA: argininosuccinate lyase [Candidatus Micrarchaeia archaeon]|nr:argininosuccinate lyase [Candidatus Micrarchaeia archaeon]